ncbi:sucrose-6-phosphate hydrolase [Halobacillus halophilus]|uniref:Sucrose-6-phosphate hydrolase n=1 Tax=Halobacillus halophilus (strain ATCC 35676 / DSM 2266 / JCM 20832 / KCTC 3685 / LMG 17431 / NBRC 102448 / NCIMB 2269) TaxID=866895 RepID=I0JSJ8_HALH3|nr:sucrose-6-phosphate hydrolase [Halobacillus halophilus]ASF41054.1 sucrose-6-phosphate hydrolase [Halobacillus halophilus]CCG47120.1 sucrose-6-phosphate hydrolase [Halobacillus halophilus DSM 2266]
MAERDQELRQAAAAEIDKYKEEVESDPYRLLFHHMPPVGLLNDPNGFVQWKGTYHLFYQWMPFDTGHGAKFWGHYTSKDFVNWVHEDIALTPSDWYDKNGVYSGSAVSHNDRLYLFYTGNVKDEEGNREAYQCLAVSDDGVNFEKQGVIAELPEGYTAHFRDPKVWKNGEHWYMVIGAQSKDLQGKAVLFQSENLYDWKHLGPVTGSLENNLDEFGFMWECPDIFELGDQDILMVSPQGLEEEGMNYANTYQSGYFAGKLNYEKPKLEHGSFHELDRGFEFYAPQTTLDEQGRRILIGWMGVPDQYEQAHPTVEKQWVHCLTLPRELTWNGEQIIQKPVNELKEMRGPALIHASITIENDQKAVRGIGGRATELNLEFEQIEDQFAVELFQYAAISYKDGILTLSRPHLENREKTEFRRVELPQGLRNLHLFIDQSALEIFVNNGEEVFTSRIFPQPEEEDILFTSLGESSFSIEQWKLSGFTFS